ncbi:LysR family transcriptional regulator [Pistricoccus aurantiacus]|uniref:LysR family transcriptional regulator n=1 Tax=Pistricoccus aurantiacus TaxID=1883414 RepID=A0A5B8SMD1_9GAMM|nr:LysR family transcriptional regulator [Pistricoccus aurantiacus]QEA38239.1 LysR family transcriptional regulator [Pistricoccus aurantiacus]
MTELTTRWNDLPLVQAIAETGSLSGAARRLNVSHATVFRRLGELERRLGVRLFERSRNGYMPTPAGDDLAVTAARVADEIAGAERRLLGRDLTLSGTLRTTTTDTLLMGLLTPILADFQAAHPRIVLEVVVANRPLNLSRRDADIAIRPGNSPPETLIGRRVGRLTQAVYEPSNSGDEALPWVGPDVHLGYPALEAWMMQQGADAHTVYKVDSMLGMLAAVRAGLGQGVLPCYLADAEPTLRRRSAMIPELTIDLWLLTHPDLRRTARVRTFFEVVAQAIEARNAVLLGEHPW